MSMSVAIDDRAVVAAFQKAPAVIDRELRKAVELGSVDFEGGVIGHTPVAFGILRNSITHQVSGSGLAIEGRVFSSDVPVKVVSVETGRSPGRRPPMAPIEAWVNKKLGISGKAGRSVAFLIARAIGRRGTTGAGMFRKGFDTALPRVQGRVNDLMAAVRRVL